MSELVSWIMDIKNSKITALLIFFTTFIGILVYVYGSKSRSKRLESYRNIPFLDDDLKQRNQEKNDSNEKLKDNDQNNTETKYR